jgi:hypothetical protein
MTRAETKVGERLPYLLSALKAPGTLSGWL